MLIFKIYQVLRDIIEILWVGLILVWAILTASIDNGHHGLIVVVILWVGHLNYQNYI